MYGKPGRGADFPLAGGRQSECAPCAPAKPPGSSARLRRAPDSGWARSVRGARFPCARATERSAEDAVTSLARSIGSAAERRIVVDHQIFQIKSGPRQQPNVH